MISFILENWAFILLAVAAAAAIVFFSFRGNKSVVMKMLHALVTEAEKALGSGTGSLKLATVIEAVYPKLPAVIKMFISEKTLTKWVEDALAAAKTEWQKNAQIAAYIDNRADTGAEAK